MVFSFNSCLINTYSDSKITVVYSTLHIIVKELWTLDKINLQVVAKYMRCMLQAMLPGPPEQSLLVMGEICEAVKKESSNVSNPMTSR